MASPAFEVTQARTRSLRSLDGTMIAYDAQGGGPALIVVDGALSTRSSGSKPELVALLAQNFTVYSYDRRGRGESGDTQPYTVAREIQDLAAVIAAAGGSAVVYGHSSGGCLALKAAVALGPAITRLAMYEVPYNDDPAAQPVWSDYLTRLATALCDGRRGDAVALFMAFVGMPRTRIDAIRRAPFWVGLEAIAPTLAYDHAAIIGADLSIPRARVAGVPCPTLVMHGESGAPFMRDTARRLARLIPDATLRTLAGQTHDVHPESLAPVLMKFFS